MTSNNVIRKDTMNYLITYRVDDKIGKITLTSNSNVSFNFGAAELKAFTEIYNEHVGARETDVNLYHIDDIYDTARMYMSQNTIPYYIEKLYKLKLERQESTAARSAGTISKPTEPTELAKSTEGTGWGIHRKIIDESPPHAIWEITREYARAYERKTGKPVYLESENLRARINEQPKPTNPDLSPEEMMIKDQEEVALKNHLGMLSAIYEERDVHKLTAVIQAARGRIAYIGVEPAADFLHIRTVQTAAESETTGFPIGHSYIIGKDVNKPAVSDIAESAEQHTIQKLEKENGRLNAQLDHFAREIKLINDRVNRFENTNADLVAQLGQAEGKLQSIALAAESILHSTKPPILPRRTSHIMALTKFNIKENGVDSPALTDKY